MTLDVTMAQHHVCVCQCVCWAPSPSSSSTVSSCLSSGMDRNLFLKWRHHRHQWNKTRASGWNPQEEINVNDVQHALKRLSQTLSGGSDQEEERETNYVKVEETHSIKVKRKDREKEIGIAFPFSNKKKAKQCHPILTLTFLKAQLFLHCLFQRRKDRQIAVRDLLLLLLMKGTMRNRESNGRKVIENEKGNVRRGETLRWLL